MFMVHTLTYKVYYVYVSADGLKMYVIYVCNESCPNLGICAMHIYMHDELALHFRNDVI